MLYSIFSELVNMSLTAAAVILIVTLLRPLLRRAPRAVTFLLWAVVLFRLVCPVSFSANFSLLRAGTTVDNRIQYLPTELIADTVRFREAESIAVVNETASKAFTLVDFSRLALVIGTWVWIIGIAVFLTSGVISLVRLRRCCIGAVRVSGNIYLADGIQVPFVMGILRPCIYLPSHLTENEQKLVLQHEAMHIRRGDPLWKLIAFLVLALHWFNPIAGLGFNLFVRDMEAACDEHVLSGMDENARADYAETLLQISVGRRFPSITPAFGEENPKTRIKSILRYKKPLKIVTVIAVVFAIAFAVILIVNPKAKTGRAGDIIPEFPQITDSYHYYTITLNSTEDIVAGIDYAYGHEEIAPMIYSFLQNLTVEVNPASQSRTENRDMTNTLSLGTNGKNKNFTDIHFSDDFSRVWINNSVKPSYTYVVENPDSVKELFTYLLTGETENVVLDAAIEANRTANETESGYITAIYCPAAQKNEAAIKIGELHAGYVSTYLCTKLSNEYGSGLDLATLDWDKTAAPSDAPSSPESVEFIINDDLRVQIWKSPRLAVIRNGGEEHWFKTAYGDYTEAVEMVLNYSLTQSEREARLEAAEEEPSISPSPTLSPTAEPTPSPTAEPTITPAPTATSSAAVTETPTTTPQPTPDEFETAETPTE